MSANSNIEWTDHTFNGWRGCTKVSPGCANCYAETLSKRNPKALGNWGPGAPRVLGADSYWEEPLKWESVAYRGLFRRCPECGWRGEVTSDDMECPTDSCEGVAAEMETVRPRVFSASLADWLDDDGVPIEWLVRLLTVIQQTPHLDWLLLTKRPENWEKRLRLAAVRIQSEPGHTENATWRMIHRWLPWNGMKGGCRPPNNVWIGVTVEDQARAHERIPWLIDIPATVRFLSCEPLLEAVDLMLDCHGHNLQRTIGQDIHWVICGGESGSHARPMHPNWAQSIRGQCAAAGVAFLFKQWGEYKAADNPLEGLALMNLAKGRTPPMRQTLGSPLLLHNVGKKAAGRLLDGVEHNAFPTLLHRAAPLALT